MKVDSAETPLPRKPSIAAAWLIGAALIVTPIVWFLIVRHDLSRHQALLANTLYLAFRVCLISLPLGTLAALLIARTNVPGRRVAAYLLGIMLFIPLYLQAAAWDAGFAKMGWYTLATQTLDNPLLNEWRAVIWIHGVTGVPWVTLVVSAGLWTMERELDEATLLDCSAVRAFFFVTAPRLLPALLIAVLWVSLMTTSEMTVTDLYRVPTYAEEVYTLFSIEDDRGSIIRQTWPGMLVVGWLTLAMVAAASRTSEARELTSANEPLAFPLRRWRISATVILIVLLLVVVGVPLFNLIYKAGFVTQQSGDQLVSRWSAAEFAHILRSGDSRFRDELDMTALLGVVSASAVFVIAAPLAWLARHGGWRGLPALGVAIVCAAIPGPLIGVFVIELFDQPSSDLLAWLYDNSILPPVIALVVRGMPLGLLLCWLTLRTIPRETLDSAALDGAGPIRRFLRIGIGQRVAPLAAAWLATYAYATGDLAASILVMPPDMSTVSIRVFGLIHSGVRQDEAALCLLSVLDFSVLALFAGWLWRRRER